ncbi:Single-stranded DNA-binding protein [Waddlia chondrophila 2032/99]|uniref:Single-stranded DNA-binding protein n=2 Tax=Waddlia chondrophila TaxID=71667 RepID=D6YW20_WADCW|nr:single-stranded DNA-binding protein [Waddlia chondrophila]ADI38331.1 putative single-stranded DNA-binding protein [Waddlia chondrophila WSU 86-1044]CCB91413.1 Single-stranded DNA-binding protein [Waddlia chondrophila 2032/99]
MNYVHIIGRLGKDPEVRYTSDNKKVTTFTLASNYVKGGQEETIWWRVTVWGDRWDKMISYLSKGKPVMVGGEMRKPETYVDKSGQTQLGSIDLQADYIKFVPFGSKEENQQNSQNSYQQSAGTESGSGSFVTDEEPLPF